MSIIEQAARRLEELRRSGITIPSATGRAAPAALKAAELDIPAAVVRRLESLPPAVPPDTKAAPVKSRLVHIDLMRLASMGYISPDAPRSQIADEFRVIKRPLLMNVSGKAVAAPVERANLIMVTSSLPSEGKTFVTINLAISMAMELDKKVLLVDADVSRPSVLPRLGLTAERGLLDLLDTPSVPISDVLLRTDIDSLSILPAGAPRGRATELLSSEAMSRLQAELAHRYSDRIIIFDTPPLLPSTESRVLAGQMGQVVLVVEAQRTPQKTVMQALATIESCQVVMPILNKARSSDVGFYYGYYGPIDA